MTDINPSIKSDILSRLESLKAKRKEAQKLNRQELFQYTKNQRIASIKSKKEKEKESNHYNEYEDDNKESHSKKWHIQKKSDGSANFNDLAESTYYKRIDKLKVDKESYKNQKELLLNQQDSGKDKSSSIVDVSNHPDAETKVEVVRFLSDINDKRMKRRRNAKDEEVVDNFINEKNKQFNMKLNRQINK
ncbi:predicted protein [Candida tropicalis MYA-3404]|uniref:Pre-mRNA-splicing factor SYF2 n=1 Tax=Candida tropicalis (strain ATCC MYA-3404 / T1) TaxID=294747 RepID=C5MFY1_CANTT|nr:predicted protein [Candida tropicalis MYA-3404]EER31244.1 predicted protein [Candida tropicalis MYA-3404]KAG4404809.1 hypothetical protein JTP64_005823 [Candida tropicalis]